ncbi:MAG: DUF488 family protein [Vulcanimicrobiaceae bacterium]
MRRSIYTVGYGNRPIDEVLSLIAHYGVQVVADVRSWPYSARFPDFSREALSAHLKQASVMYVFLGDELGARPTDPDLYVAGRVSYEAMARSSAFRGGIERVELGIEKYRCALLCAEKDPLDCHRAVLIGRCLQSEGIEVQHIDASGEIEAQEALEWRLLRRYKLEQVPLFDSVSSKAATDEAYARRGKELAYDIDAAYRARRDE